MESHYNPRCQTQTEDNVSFPIHLCLHFFFKILLTKNSLYKWTSFQFDNCLT